jgi:hypothetical protein
MECIKKVGAWADRFQRNDPIAYFFEQGSRWAKDVVTAMQRVERVPDFKRRFRYASWGFAYKDTLVPLQAADMLAYELYKQAINRQLPPARQRPMRKSLRAITDLVTNFSVYDEHTWDAERQKKTLPHPT